MWTLPGWLSLSRVAFAIVFPFAIEQRGLAVMVLAAAALSDFLDGYLARRLNRTSATGAALDPITDKIFAISVMVTLLATSRLSIAHAVLLSVRELLELPLAAFLATVPRARVVRSAHLGANMLGKLTTALQFGALVAVLFELRSTELWVAATSILGALAAVAYWQRFLLALRGTERAN